MSQVQPKSAPEHTLVTSEPLHLHPPLISPLLSLEGATLALEFLHLPLSPPPAHLTALIARLTLAVTEDLLS